MNSQVGAFCSVVNAKSLSQAQAAYGRGCNGLLPTAPHLVQAGVLHLCNGVYAQPWLDPCNMAGRMAWQPGTQKSLLCTHLQVTATAEM